MINIYWDLRWLSWEGTYLSKPVNEEFLIRNMVKAFEDYLWAPVILRFCNLVLGALFSPIHQTPIVFWSDDQSDDSILLNMIGVHAWDLIARVFVGID